MRDAKRAAPVKDAIRPASSRARLVSPEYRFLTGAARFLQVFSFGSKPFSPPDW